MWFISPRAISCWNQRKACHHGDAVGRWGGGEVGEVVEEAALSKSLEEHRVGREGLWEARSKCKHIYRDCCEVSGRGELERAGI